MKLPLLSILTAAAVTAGCTAGRPPVVAVTGVRVVDVTDAGAAVRVALELTNPNDYPLPLERVSYRVSLRDGGDGGWEPYVADTLPGRSIPARGTQTLTLPAALAAGPGGGDAAALERWRVSGTLTYAPDRGLRAFLTETGVPLPFVGFSGAAGEGQVE